MSTTAAKMRQRLGRTRSHLRKTIQSRPENMDVDLSNVQVDELSRLEVEMKIFQSRICKFYQSFDNAMKDLDRMSDVSLEEGEIEENGELEFAGQDLIAKVEAILSRIAECRATEERRKKFELEAKRLESEVEERRQRLEVDKQKLEMEKRECEHRLHVHHDAVTPHQNEIADLVGSQTSKVRLPKLSLPEFDGTPTKWKTFWDAFTAAVDQNMGLNSQQKLNYLISLLKGGAEKAVRGLAITNENYSVAVEILRERFGSTARIIETHYQALLDLPPARTMSYVRTTVDSFEVHLRSLEALGQDINGAALMSQLKSKLPAEFLRRLKEWERMQIIMTNTQGQQPSEWTMAQLRQAIQQIVEIHCESIDFRQNRKADRFPNATSWKTTESLVAHSESIPECVFCHNRHFSDACQKFSTREDRKQQLKDECFVCLKSGHRAADCNNRKRCYYCRQIGKHHSSLCPKRRPKQSFKTKVTEDEQEKKEEVREATTLFAVGKSVFLQTATAILCADEKAGKTAKIKILLDPGSSCTYIRKQIVTDLGIKSTGSQCISVSTFGSRKKILKVSTVTIHLKLANNQLIPITANVRDQIAEPLVRSPDGFESVEALLEGYTLADETLGNEESFEIDLLIGNDYWFELITGPIVPITERFGLIKTKLGYILSGSISSSNNYHRAQTSMLTFSEFEHENQLIKTTEDHECSGCKLQSELEKSLEFDGNATESEDQNALNIFKTTIRNINGRYEVTWPWKSVEILPPKNYDLASKRLISVYHRLRKNPQLLEKYDMIIKDQYKKKIIEKVPAILPETRHIKMHYLAHHPVITPEKTTKVRIVYDGSAKTKETQSLNECLHRGPVILEDACRLLLRFRMYPVALTADIEKAFLQVGLQEVDRDVTRFLWLKDLQKPPQKENIEEYRFTRVPFGIISSPFLLAATIQHHLKTHGGKIAEKVAKHIYVDNVITGCESAEEAKVFYTEAKKIFKLAAMNLREWNTNSINVKQSFLTEDRSTDIVAKVLGISWDTTKDTISNFKPKQSLEKDLITKRTVLSFVHSNFDPLGIASPAHIRIKCFLQTIWQKKLHWDEPLQEEDKEKFNKMRSEIVTQFPPIVPRWIGWKICNNNACELHVFCDASTIAYAAAVYLRETSKSKTTVNLLFAKTRVAPTRKSMSIPRLELLAIHLGSQIIQYVAFALQSLIKINQNFVWSDSQCALFWIKSKKSLSVFVENRVKKIRTVQNSQFRYVPTKSNPADIATRGQSSETLQKNQQWWHGPTWLTMDTQAWPELEPHPDKSTQTMIEFEERTCVPIYSATLIVANDQHCRLIPENYSSLQKLLRLTALCRKFIQKCKKRDANRTGYQLTAVDLREAEEYWIKFEQAKWFPQELKRLSKSEQAVIRNLALELDKVNIIRCKGRIAAAPLGEDAINPILLPRTSSFTALLIDKIHRDLHHAGTSHTLSQIRQRFWIPAGRRAVFNRIRGCIVCKRMDGGPYIAPPMPNLPFPRVNFTLPFACTGLDYIGPVLVKNNNSVEKRWICLFTCGAIRAVHLELVENLSSQSFLTSLRLFMARRGTPSQIWSDNAKPFIAQFTKDFATNHGIEWKYIFGKSPWMGGFYERMVGIVKRALIKSTGNQLFTTTQLRLLLAEIERSVNSRPLLQVESDLEAAYITPQHFLSPSLSPYQLNIDAPDERTTKQLWPFLRQSLERFHSIWKQYYLTALREKQTINLKQGRVKAKIEPKVGEIVLIKSDGPRHGWAKGLITHLLTSNDGCIRGAQLRTTKGRKITRAIASLYPLELLGEQSPCPEYREAKC